jgi:hypothetical protein
LGSNFQVPLSQEEEEVTFFPKKKMTKLEKGIKLPQGSSSQMFDKKMHGKKLSKLNIVYTIERLSKLKYLK